MMVSSMSNRPLGVLPIDGAVVRRASQVDAPELLVLQRCCWVDEAIANDTLDIPALHETLEDVRARLDDWTTWCMRAAGRLVGAVRARQEGPLWDIGRRCPSTYACYAIPGSCEYAPRARAASTRWRRLPCAASTPG